MNNCSFYNFVDVCTLSAFRLAKAAAGSCITLYVYASRRIGRLQSRVYYLVVLLPLSVEPSEKGVLIITYYK